MAEKKSGNICYIILIALLLAVAIWFIVKCISRPESHIEIPTSPQITKVSTKDSVDYRTQELLIVQSQSTILALRDSIQRLITEAAHISPTILVKYRQSFEDSMLIASYRDTVDLLKSIADSSLADTLYKYRDRLVLTPKSFAHNSKWVDIYGTILKDKTMIDSLKVRSEPVFIVGEAGRWWEEKTLNIQVADRNPNVKQSELSSYYYKPKEKKFAIVVGGTLVFDGNSLRRGFGITIGYKIY